MITGAAASEDDGRKKQDARILINLDNLDIPGETRLRHRSSTNSLGNEENDYRVIISYAIW